MNDKHLLDVFESLRETGRDLAALDLHLEALAAAVDGDQARANARFADAQKWESSKGYSDGALHTAHQMALTSNFGGDLRRLDEYYHETTRTLTKMRNRKGVALCLRSIGEIAIVKSDKTELTKAWDLSERLFVMLHAPEASQMAAWQACLREVLDRQQ